MTPELDNLDSRIAKLYRAQRLDDHRLQELRSLVGAEPASGQSGKGFGWPRRVAVAAAMLIALAGLWIAMQRRSTARLDARARGIAVEVAEHHHKHPVMDIQVHDFAALAQALPRLDFAPTAPQRVRAAGFRVAGARYCGIGDGNAVQIQLLDSSGAKQTLCQFRASAEFDRLAERTFKVGNLAVDVWKEDGLVMGLTRPLE